MAESDYEKFLLSVISAVESLAAIGNVFMTIEMIYRQLNENVDVKLTAKAKENIESAIEYLKNLDIKIDPAEPMLLNCLKEYEFVYTEQKALRVIKAKKREGNKIVSGYIYEGESAWYKYVQKAKNAEVKNNG